MRALVVRQRAFSLPKLRWPPLFWLLLVVMIAIAGPILYRRDPAANEINRALEGPSVDRALGTDSLGRDELARLLHAGRVSLTAAAVAVGTAVLAGLPLGLVAGYFGGRVDGAARRVIDTIMSFPPLILVVAVIGVTGPGLVASMLAVGLVQSVRIARIARAMSLSVREEMFIDAARSIGCTHWRILRHHVLRNISVPVIVEATLLFGSAVIAESSLSYIGLGVQPPTASWGLMLRDGSLAMDRAPFLVVFPGLAIMGLVLAANAAGEGLRRSISGELSRDE